MFISPAIVELHKHILILFEDEYLRDRTSLEDKAVMHLLTRSITAGMQLSHLAVKQPSMDVFLGLFKHAGSYLLPTYRPTPQLCDVELLRVLLGTQGDAGFVEVHDRLLVALVRSWPAESSGYRPFPGPSVSDQVIGVLQIARHCVVVNLR